MSFTLHIDSGRTWGGGQEQSLGLALALAERRERVHFIAQRDSALAARLASTELPWEGMPLRGLIGVAGSLRLRGRLRQLSPDIVHVHDSTAETAVMLAMGQRRRAAVVVTRRTAFGLRRSMVRLALYRRQCDRMICVSQAVRRRCLEAGMPDEALAVIPDFVDCRRFAPGAVEPASLEAGPTIAAVGRLTAEKGHAVLVRAMARVPEATLVICGQGEEEPRLRRQAEMGGISDRVRFLWFQSDVRPVLAAADVFAMPSLSEGLGVAALEAMAMGKPVVASNTGGLPDVMVDGETGLLVPPGDPEALAEALTILLRDPTRARAMGEAGRARALERFDREVVVPQVLALYDQVLHERPRWSGASS